MKIFISGIAGFLGSHLADHFLAHGAEVVGNDTLIGGYLDNVPARAEFSQIDCNDNERIRSLMNGCDVVYHCAATAYEGLSVFSPHLVTQNIVTATTGMVSAAVSVGVKRFVFCSSMARYGAQEVPFTENMIPRPVDPYGIGKVAAEDLLMNIADTHGMEWAIAVPHNIIGPRQKYDDPYRNVAAIFINRMLRGDPPYIYGDGKQMRCFSFVSDVVSPLAQLATSDVCNREIFNIGPDGEFITVIELAETIRTLLDSNLNPVFTRGRPKEVKLANCSADKARKILGYSPQVSLRDGLMEMILWIKKRGSKEFRYHLPLEIVNERTPETWSKRLF